MSDPDLEVAARWMTGNISTKELTAKEHKPAVDVLPTIEESFDGKPRFHNLQRFQYQMVTSAAPANIGDSNDGKPRFHNLPTFHYDMLSSANNDTDFDMGPLGAYEVPKIGISVEFLYRYSILLARMKILRHIETIKSRQAMDVDASVKIMTDLSQYANALRDYRFLRGEGKELFDTGGRLDPIITQEALIQAKEAELAKLLESSSPGDWRVTTAKAEINRLRAEMVNNLESVIFTTTSGMSKQHQNEARKALWSRLWMALGGGLALIVPMLIMILRPSQLVAMVTTSCCVVGVAVVLAIFMVDSQPKDVVACTVAYAAVLVVFVGTGGGGTEAATGA